MQCFISFMLLGLLFNATSGYSQCTSTRVFNDYLSVELNSNSSKLTISGLACDPCQVAEGQMSICLCRQACNIHLPDQGAFEGGYATCINNCAIQFPIDLIAYDECITQCAELLFQGYDACINNCGNYSTTRQATSYAFVAVLWYTEGFVPSAEGDPDEIFQSGVVNGAPPATITINLVNTPSESYSYCYFTELLVSYDDGSCCRFRNFDCFAIG